MPEELDHRAAAGDDRAPSDAGHIVLEVGDPDETVRVAVTPILSHSGTGEATHLDAYGHWGPRASHNR